MEILLIALGNLLVLGVTFAAVLVIVKTITSRSANRTLSTAKPRFCHKCGYSLPPNSDVCPACGADISQGNAKTPESTPPPQD